MSTVLKAQTRTNEQHSQLNELRKQGNVPAIVYGYNVENTPISVESKSFLKVMREVGRNGVISLDLEGKKLNVILHEYQEDSLRREVTHADFLAVDMMVEIDANVLIELSNDAPGVKSGGVLQHILHELSITAKPDDIPEEIKVDISGLEIGDSITVGDIRGNYSVVINHEDEESIASVQPPREEEEATEEASESTEDQADEK
ncbi:50S ribosomal protein L25/general stress protein Ctc [Lederbergia lenta]|nr:50S ribosomal protein L25/general stress protein Ctc [Lederbergia lenta]MCM3113561.1 50S ribosomal protein L25/general stress protein Ctc [Lederbergia lenta]MEC2323830.1 50S ribosomal protein L25/general stress protein Ctc [Lederbergia lenta]